MKATISTILLMLLYIACLMLWSWHANADTLAINLHGFSKQFSSTDRHGEPTNNTNHMLLGLEYCRSDYCASYNSYRDQSHVRNNALAVHRRYTLGYVQAGLAATYIHEQAPRLAVVPELLISVDGAGVRLICVPDSKRAPGFCAVNLRIELL